MELEEAIGKALKRESDPKLAAAAAADAANSTSAASTNSSPASSPAAASNTSRMDTSVKDNGKSAADSSTPLSGIEAAGVSANIYKNPALGMTFQFPQGWIAANEQTLHAINDRNEATAKASIVQQHPELANSLNLSISKVIFYASRKGGGDGQRIDVPSIRITAVPSRLDSVSLDAFQKMVENRATASGMKVTAPASEFQVNKHQFVRADFDKSVGAIHLYQSFVQTIAGDYLLNIEIYADSPEELQQVAASLQAMSITDEDP